MGGGGVGGGNFFTTDYYIQDNFNSIIKDGI